MPKAKQRAVIAIRATGEYNKIVGEICDLLQVNRPRLFREALVRYLVGTRFWDSNSVEIPRDRINKLADKLLAEDLNNKTYRYYVKPTQSNQQ